MLFNSWQYVVFLPLVVAGYYLLPHKYRWGLLLCASYYFYMSWNAKLVFLILTTTATSYATALLLERTQDPRRRKLWLGIGVGVSLALLAFFKYFNFFSASVTALLRAVSLPVDDFTVRVMLPVGISFYTFQTLSYVIDVYKGDLKAERHFGIYALYVSFFPQLVAGPIERAKSLLPQLHERHTANAEDLSWGLRMICLGLLKKMAIADFVAVFVNRVFNDLSQANAVSCMFAAVLFAIQIYCDFSGYSDIALGSARLMGFRLMQNFRAPYLSRTIQDFWHRWHISLSTWFSDYIYIPLGGSRTTRGRHMCNLLLTFLLSGLWHGAAWTFVLWGAVHGVAQIAAKLTFAPRARLRARLGIKETNKLYHAWQILCIFGLVCLAYVFFRANTVADAFTILKRMPLVIVNPVEQLQHTVTFLGFTGPVVARLLFSLAALFAVDTFSAKKLDPMLVLARQKPWVRWVADYALMALVALCFFTLPENVTPEFIYFQF